MFGLTIRRPRGSAIWRGTLTASIVFAATSAWAEPLHIVVPDRAYADLAETIAGPPVSVSVAGPFTARSTGAIALAPGSVVLCSGTRADAWLREAASRAGSSVTVIEVYNSAEGSKTVFPWYDLKAITAFSRAIVNELARREPASAARLEANLARLLSELNPVKARIDELSKDYARSDIIVADDLSRDVALELGFRAKGLPGRNRQNASGSQVSASVEEAIQRHEGSIFLYDKDISNPSIKTLVAAATDSAVPVVALQEKMPTNLHVPRWALRQWNTIHGALNEAAP